MENPDLRTLISFLNQVKKQAPVNFSGLARGRRRGYGMVNRYLRYCASGRTSSSSYQSSGPEADTPPRPTP
jgi:hypothetical protein